LWCRTCVWCRDLEHDAISAAEVEIGIQQLLEGDHGCAGFRPAQFAAHLENLPGQVVGLLACTATVVLVGARGSNARGQVSPHCAHCVADGRYFWPRQAAAVLQVNCLQRPQGSWHTTLGWGMVCAGEGQITLAPVGAGHAVYTCDPHTGTHTASPGMQMLRGATICGLARVFGWHHLVFLGKPFDPRT
jgi:hypothetical protein